MEAIARRHNPTLAFVAGVVVAFFICGVILAKAQEVISQKQTTIDYLIERSLAVDPEQFIQEHTFEEICGVEL